MWGMNYRGCSIQGYFDRDECQVIIDIRDAAGMLIERTIRKTKTLIGAKRLISKHNARNRP